MKLLISPADVARLAFRAPDFIEDAAVPEATILAAEQKFIVPVLGATLCDRLRDGAYPSLLEEYVAPPLALYVKMSMLPSLAVQAGAAGVVEVRGPNITSAGDRKLHAAVRRLRGEALALVKRAVTHIEAANANAPDCYPEYDIDTNILHRCSIDGGIVLSRSGRRRDKR